MTGWFSTGRRMSATESINRARPRRWSSIRRQRSTRRKSAATSPAWRPASLSPRAAGPPPFTLPRPLGARRRPSPRGGRAAPAFPPRAPPPRAAGPRPPPAPAGPAPPASAPPPPTPAAPATPAGSARRSTGTGDAAAVAPTPSPAPAAAAAGLPGERETLEQLRSLSQQLATAPPVRLTPPASKSTAASPSESVPSATAARRGTASAPSKPPAPPSGDEADAVNTPAGRNATPPERSPAFLDAQAKRTAARIAVADARALGPPVPVRRSEGQGLRFKWPDPVTAAAFARGPYVFLLFNKRAPLDLSAVRTPPPDDLVGEITTVPSEGTARRLAPPPG